jgi:hypothetical protein
MAQISLLVITAAALLAGVPGGNFRPVPVRPPAAVPDRDAGGWRHGQPEKEPVALRADVDGELLFVEGRGFGIARTPRVRVAGADLVVVSHGVGRCAQPPRFW